MGNARELHLRATIYSIENHTSCVAEACCKIALAMANLIETVMSLDGLSGTTIPLALSQEAPEIAAVIRPIGALGYTVSVIQNPLLQQSFFLRFENAENI